MAMFGPRPVHWSQPDPLVIYTYMIHKADMFVRELENAVERLALRRSGLRMCCIPIFDTWRTDL